MLILQIYAKAYDTKFCYCINFVGFDFSEVDQWPAAGVIDVVVNGDTIPVHLIHVRYHDVLAYGSTGYGIVELYVCPEHL
jgi:hypothetical protein